MATCEVCNQEMLSADGCTQDSVELFGVRYARIKYDGKDRCHDCGCKYGYFHHSGCDNEICPRCGFQLISCNCEKDLRTDDEIADIMYEDDLRLND